MSKNSSSFLHYSNARNDQKIMQLRAKFGWQGYGLYFAILEILREADNNEIEYDPEVLAFSLGIKQDELPPILDLLIKVDLLQVDGEFLFSSGLKDRVDAFIARSSANSENGKLGGRPRKANKNQELSEVVKIENQNESEIKANEKQSESQSLIKQNKIKLINLKKQSAEFHTVEEFNATIENAILANVPEPEIEYFKQNARVQSERYPLIYISESRRIELIEHMQSAGLDEDDYPEVLKWFQGWAEEKTNSKLKTERRKYEEKSDHALCMEKWAVPAVVQNKTTRLRLETQKVYSLKARQ